MSASLRAEKVGEKSVRCSTLSRISSSEKTPSSVSPRLTGWCMAGFMVGGVVALACPRWREARRRFHEYPRGVYCKPRAPTPHAPRDRSPAPDRGSVFHQRDREPAWGIGENDRIHRTHLLAKLQCHCVAGLVRYAVYHGVVELGKPGPGERFFIAGPRPKLARPPQHDSPKPPPPAPC